MGDASGAFSPQGTKGRVLVRLWRGEERLWKAYWLMGLVGGWAVSTLVVNLIGMDVLPVIPGLIVFLLYAAFVGIAVWRCAFNVKRPVWGYLARAMVLASLLYGVVETTLLLRALWQGPA